MWEKVQDSPRSLGVTILDWNLQLILDVMLLNIFKPEEEYIKTVK